MISSHWSPSTIITTPDHLLAMLTMLTMLEEERGRGAGQCRSEGRRWPAAVRVNMEDHTCSDSPATLCQGEIVISVQFSYKKDVCLQRLCYYSDPETRRWTFCYWENIDDVYLKFKKNVFIWYFISRLGRQYSISSDYVGSGGASVHSLYDPSYNFPSFHGISDSLRATIGDPPVVGLAAPGQHDRDYLDSDYLLHPGPGLYYDPREGGRSRQNKKTVRFDSVTDPDTWVDSGNESLDFGWMTIQDLRNGSGSRWTPGLAHRAPHLWDRQESLDSQAR